MRNNKHLLNKIFSLKVIGKGKSGDPFGKINDTICFIKLKEGQKVKFGDIAEVKINSVWDKCVFAELLTFEKSEEDWDLDWNEG